MMINLFKLVNIVSSFFCLTLSISLLKSTIKRISKYTFSIFLISLSSLAWSLNMTLQLFFANNPQIGNFLVRFNWIGAFIVASYTFSSLVLVLKDKVADVVGIIQYIVAGIFLGLAFTKFGIKEVVSIFPLKRIPGEFTSLFRLWIIVSIFYSLYLSIKHYFSLPDRIEKLKHKYYVFSIIVYAIFGVVFVGILPLLGYENLIYLTPLGAIFWVLGLFYAVEQYRVLDIEVLFYDILRYATLIILGIIFNYIFLQLFLWLNFSYIISSTASIILISSLYLFSPLRETIDKVIKSNILKERKNYQKLLDLTSKALVEILDLESLLRYVVNQLHTSLGVSKIAIFLKDKQDEKDNKVYRLAMEYGLRNVTTVYFKNQKIINWLSNNKEPFLVDLEYSSLNKEEIKELVDNLRLFGAILIIPIIYNKDELLGMITLDQKKVDGNIFDIEDIEVLKKLADQLAIAIKNSMVYKELDDAYMQITRALSLTLESKDEYLIGHTDKVTKYALILAKKIGLSDRDLYIITQAAMLHDLGKVGIHDYILNKPGSLTKEEWEEIKQHPIKGAKILKSLPFLDKVAEVILYHHEHYDGSGYPAGLKGEEIPLLSRVLTLADAVDAMLSERPYKDRKMTIKEVIEELKLQKGKHFDPYLVDKFIEIIEEHSEIFEMKKEDYEKYRDIN